MPEALGRSAGLTGYADLCRTLGLDPYRLAAEAQVPGAALTDPDLKIPANAVARMLEAAARRAGIDDFGLRLAETRRLSNMGAVGLVAREQPSLRAALEVMAQYLWLQNEALSLALEDVGDAAVLRLLVAGGGRASRQGVELSIGVLTRNIRQLTVERWRPLAVLFRHGAPASLQVHRRVFGVDPQFGADLDGLLLPRAELDSTLAAAEDPDMARQAERLIAQLAQNRSRALGDQAAELIVLLLPTGACTAARVARHLGCDRRTLHRRLAAEGLTFTALLEAKRRDLVRTLLAQRERSMAQIADLAGFASPSAFSHWARRVFGASPRMLRAERRNSQG